MSQVFYSHGKLLLSGEYLVLDGAKALAIPTKFGQSLEVKPFSNHLITWKSIDFKGSVWFKSTISWREIEHNSIENEHSEIKLTLVQILHHAYRLNPNIDFFNQGFEVNTNLSFPREWGLGTSSTLINNIAKWFQVDAFQLLKLSFGGSGYDIACADSSKAIVYQRIDDQPVYKEVDFYPKFHQELYFLYLNQKQNSKAAITAYFNKRQNVENEINQINALTQKMIASEQGDDFRKLILKHEFVMSHVLEMQTVQERFFPDFEGAIKSLGAWGGDFVMVHSKLNPRAYFESKGFETLLGFNEMVLQKDF